MQAGVHKVKKRRPVRVRHRGRYQFEADEDGEAKQKRTGQTQPDGHVTKLRSLGTQISRLWPGHADPVKGGSNQTFWDRFNPQTSSR
ncbi:hypothetical protein CROQUDRAFT_390380 [Cronartium quercuum f. sp. fusiforme G11]|uniref:Uncharacterized protein n=1 Tax=Cronartium quercuum f. sp. fusiforme G11 TaxID=708437 RepID=A0A9P6NN21_9BASI|nr:hypothetical protein CROQUDRAFT_390380 [Cronartium quercuum f. sp. fusiforme G11]